MPGRPAAASASAVAPARRCAYAVLRRVFERGAYCDEALRAEARGLQPRDRALAMRLAYGAVQRRATVDHVLERLAERPLARLQPPVLAALRLGLHEQLFTSGAPDYAIVGDSVQLAKENAPAGHGLVNAVLRRAAREGPAELLGDLDDSTPEQAAVMHSHPLWLAQMWWRELGAEQARALMAADNEPSEVALRANTLLIDAEQLAAALPVRSHRDAALPEALVLEQPFDVHGSPQWRRGELIAQSRAAMLVARALDPRGGERVLDLCAAPGGKATHIAALMSDHGEVLAVERNRSRAGVLARTAERLRVGSLRVEVADARVPLAGHGEFDRVLVDPPCSGLGTLQAHPDLRWRMTPGRIAEMARAAGEILAAGARVLRPGGLLVYSTCTISTTENERVIASFLDSNPDFRIDDPAASVRARGPGGASASDDGFLRTAPHRDGTAGFFIARLRRG
jgi:16S rRNA (cytosine967-C5)-methyltransferase